MKCPIAKTSMILSFLAHIDYYMYYRRTQMPFSYDVIYVSKKSDGNVLFQTLIIDYKITSLKFYTKKIHSQTKSDPIRYRLYYPLLQINPKKLLLSRHRSIIT